MVFAPRFSSISIPPGLSNIYFYSQVLLLVLLGPTIANGADYKNFFPRFEAIEKNVVFWEKIYSTYSGNTAIVHDRRDLSVIYETIPLLDSSLPGSRRVNAAYLKSVKKKYSSILQNLSTGKQPVTKEERRVAGLFHPPGKLAKMREAATNIRTQRGLKERFKDGVIRSGAYLETMKGIFRSYGLPEDLAYLPHVESSFNTRAYSKYGAAGMWQFTRATGKRYLEINYIVDKRLDPISATHAAARYLKRAFDNLGSWPLAITSYNYGHAGMLRALKQHETYESIFNDYNQGHFKFASRNFYAEFLAARDVARTLEKQHAGEMHDSDDFFHLILPGYVSAAELSAYLRIDKDLLRRMNPALLSPIWQGEKYIPRGYTIFLPNRQRISMLAGNLPASILKQRQKRSRYYQVKRGDTAGKIARQFDVSLKRLSQTNNLDSNALVYIGQTLRIPPAASDHSTGSNRSQQRRSNSSFEGTVPILQEQKKNSAG